MKIEKNIHIAVATYKFEGFSFEDVVHKDTSLKFRSIDLTDWYKVDWLPVDVKFKEKLKEKYRDEIQSKLDGLAEMAVKNFDSPFKDVKLQKIELGVNDEPCSAVMEYHKVYDEFEPRVLYVWFLAEVFEFKEFFLKEAKINFPLVDCD